MAKRTIEQKLRYRIKKLSLDFCTLHGRKAGVILDADGNILTPKPLPFEQAQEFLDELKKSKL